MLWPTPYYTLENTNGCYTQYQLDRVNLELCDLLANARTSNDDSLSDEETNAMLKQHMDNVAKR